MAPPDLAALDIPDASDGAQVGVAWHLYCHDTDGGRPERADERFVAWMYWHQPRVAWPTESSLPDVVESQIARPSPHATAGTPGRLS